MFCLCLHIFGEFYVVGTEYIYIYFYFYFFLLYRYKQVWQFAYFSRHKIGHCHLPNLLNSYLLFAFTNNKYHPRTGETIFSCFFFQHFRTCASHQCRLHQPAHYKTFSQGDASASTVPFVSILRPPPSGLGSRCVCAHRTSTQ